MRNLHKWKLGVTVMRRFIVILLCAVASWAQSLTKVATIDLPGPKGQRFDYLTMDQEDHYLLSAHLGPGILYVIDYEQMHTDPSVSALWGKKLKII